MVRFKMEVNMKKFIVLTFAFIILFTNAMAAEYPDLKPLPSDYRSLPLRERIAAIAESQSGYTQAYNGATIFHQEMFKNLKRKDYRYDCPWNTIYIAWVFKKCGIYSPTFENYSPINKDTLEKRFMTAGNTDGELAFAYFDYTYLPKAKPGDLVFIDKFRRDRFDYIDMSTKRNNSQVSIVVRTNQGALSVISPYYHLKVWEGELNSKYNFHNPYRIAGFGVIDAKPQKDTLSTIKTPLIAYERDSGRQIIVYYLYKDGTCLTSNGERNTSDFLMDIPDKPEDKMSAKMRSTLYKKSSGDENFGTLPDMTPFNIIGRENGRVQITLPWNLYDGKAEFPIQTTAWINQN